LFARLRKNYSAKWVKEDIAPMGTACILCLKGERFSANKNVEHRKLLWHGTNVAVVAAILKGGLRIMPHSGGRVGKGLYFASENGKSAGYGTKLNSLLL